ncbi:MAG: serine protease [Pseudomonadota bacterium]
MKILIVLLTCLTCSTGVFAQGIATAIQTTMRVLATQPDGSVSVGSGVVLPGERVATACHVVEGATEIEVSYRYVASPATLARQDRARDVCVLGAPGLAAPAAKLARSTDLKAGDRLLAFSGAYGNDVRLMIGEVNAVHPMDGGAVIETSVPFVVGDSGGGLFNNDGELIGLLAFISSTPGEKRYAIPVEWLEADIDAGKSLPFWKGDAARLPAFLRP